MSDLSGHRARLRKRILTNGPDTLLEYERLEVLLSYVIPRRDTKSLAKKLIQDNQGLSNVIKLAAQDPTLVSERFSVLLRLCLDPSLWQEMGTKRVQSAYDVIDMLREKLSLIDHEEFHVMYLGAHGELLFHDVISQLGDSHVKIDMQSVIRLGVRYQAKNLILSHNHPHGSAKPSQHDIDLTNKLDALANAVGMQVLDHLIFSKKSGVYSIQNASMILKA